MSLLLLNDFLNSYTAENEAKTENVAQVPEESPEKPTETAKEEAASSINSPPPDKVVEPSTQIVPTPSANTLEAFGILTEAGSVPIIDDEHTVKALNQPLKDQFAKGKRVRYSYVEKGGMRKDIIVLECGINEPKVEENWDEELKRNEENKNEPVAVAGNVNGPAPVASESRQKGPPVDDDQAKQWMGLIKNVRTNDGLTFIEVEFQNGTTEIIHLNEKNCARDYRPMTDDKIVVFCETEPSDEDEEVELFVCATGIIPADQLSGGGTITELCNEYGVLDKHIYFTEMVEGYEVGTYLDYIAVPCVRDEFKWRCLSTSRVEKPQRALQNNNQEYLDNPENYEDRNGLAIANRNELSFRMFTIHQEAEQKIVIANTGDTPYRLLNLWFASPKGRPQIRPRSNIRPTAIAPKSQIEVRIHAKAQFICNYEECAIALFNNNMCLVTRVRIAVGSDEVIRSVNQRERQYLANRIHGKADEPINPNVELFRLPKPSRKFVETRIKSYQIPVDLWKAMCEEEKQFEENVVVKYPYLEEPLSAINYTERFHQMIHISEAHLKKCFRVYEMKDQRLEREKFGENHYFRLNIENLAESRPSVLLEDTVVAQNAKGKFTGSIKRIFNDRVLFAFHEQLAERVQEEKFDVSFLYNRGPFNKLHHALDEMDKNYGGEFLFPETVEEREPLLDVHYDCPEEATDKKQSKAPMKNRMPNGEMVPVPWQNSDLNWYQKKAIVNALRGECRPLPHLICGPPGTGKTSTLVELVLQQFLSNNQSHILVCTPSNSAANLILEKLIASDQLLRDHFMRVIGFQVREKDLIPDELLPYCGTVEKSKDGTEGREISVLENGFRENCQMEYLCNFRIIILTIGSVGTFMEMGFPKGHFSHLNVDEAGQCLETEVLIPMTLLTKDSGHTVLVGDEKQLGPVVQFHPLVKWGYGLSLFERLQQFPMYNRADTERYDQRLCYQLVNNYRSVPTILSVYNILFYGKTLKPMILDENEAEYECLRAVSPIFPPAPYRTKDAAVFFYSVKTVCKRTSHNPSWINPGEAMSVRRFYKKLLECGVAPMDVGIISPYQEQVRVLRSEIANDGMEVPKVGSVEEFQGQEKMIILISTVRSKRRCEDKQFGLGFVNNPKRINVALSRARCLLVVFGNPLIIGEDPNWKSVLIRCQKQMCYFEEDPIAK